MFRAASIDFRRSSLLNLGLPRSKLSGSKQRDDLAAPCRMKSRHLLCRLNRNRDVKSGTRMDQVVMLRGLPMYVLRQLEMYA